ncbi:hypothetical protein COHA_001001 [Chlorella ohadii]|uniref:Amino acid transporter transmembrane domain-containing protein n=1 Tax=Chlorella ohadii TaxID=2649997 RepID=A0AAD5H699_9CHLO|nr:hypothetical protein COHA_001001 [Chlorella ohadii]
MCFILSLLADAILPIPYAFAVSGAVASSLIIFFVALSNVFTCKLLLRSATATGTSDYEGLSAAVGGPWLKMGEAFGYAISTQWPDAPGWLWERNGTAAMLFFTLVVIFPLSNLPRMRHLEIVGNSGIVILFALAVIVMVKAISNGMPALASGDFPHVSSGDLTSISETFSLLCFAFYHQVMMMPMLNEMPRITSDVARRSAKELHRASTITILGTSGAYYWITGFFGASMYGASGISDNFLENIWLPGVGTFILNLIVTIYLSISIPPIFHATNHSIDVWLLQLFPRNYGGLRPWAQRLILNCITIFTCLGVAVAVPGESGTVLTVTGATGVAVCSYITPVLIHFLLYFGKARCMRVPPPGAAESGVELATAAALGPAASGAAEKDAEAGEGALPAPDATDGSSDGGLTKAAAIDGAALAPAKGEAATYVPHPDAPAGLFYPYRKQRCHTLMLIGYDFVLPILVVALGCFFSVTTLVLLFQPGGEE